jgi:thioredoxin-like negative regulator of GroEL|tara:strand:+ start:764 stop:1006 length:243 start_codon:yes stop_codon:yes gene_type:complete
MSKIYYFSAPWCGPCKMLGPVMDKSGLPFQKINVDNDSTLSAKYGIRNVPTLVKVDASGNEISRLVGNNPLDKIKSWYNG